MVIYLCIVYLSITCFAGVYTGLSTRKLLLKNKDDQEANAM